jgi:hypothetical protein
VEGHPERPRRAGVGRQTFPPAHEARTTTRLSCRGLRVA